MLVEQLSKIFETFFLVWNSFCSTQNKKDGQPAEQGGEQPNPQYCCCFRESAAHQPMRQMVIVTDVKRLADAPAQNHDPHQVPQGNRQDQQRTQHSPRMRIFAGIKVWQYCQDGEQIADQMTARIAKKSGSTGKVVGQESDERAADQKGN